MLDVLVPQVGLNCSSVMSKGEVEPTGMTQPVQSNDKLSVNKDEAVVNLLESDSVSRTYANTSKLSLNGGSNWKISAIILRLESLTDEYVRRSD